jgi:hypothetical protein
LNIKQPVADRRSITEDKELARLLETADSPSLRGAKRQINPEISLHHAEVACFLVETLGASKHVQAASRARP